MNGIFRSGFAARAVACLSLAPAFAVAYDEVDGWLCTADAGTAYRYDAGRQRWETVVFSTGARNFVVRPSATPGRLWEVAPANPPGPTVACEGDFDADGLLVCGPDEDFRMNRNDLTFSTRLLDPSSAPVGAMSITTTGRCTETGETP